MPTETIVQDGHPTLREVAQNIPREDITSPQTQDIIARMKQALATQNDGVAIAAPQIGESVRIFVVAGHAFALHKDENLETHTYPDLVCINPRIIKTSKKEEDMEEGCLSVRWKYGKVRRATQVTIEALDETGTPFERGGSGLIAQIFQHEIDHLDGILFIDKARNIVESRPKESESHD